MNGIITRNVIRVVFIVAILFSIVGCSDNDENNTTPSLTSTNVVEVVFSPSGFGDLGYNDIILTGLEESRKRLGFDVMMHVPASVEDGIAIYNKWAQKTAKDERRLFIFASNQYESALRNSSVRPSDANSSVLLYETHEPIDGVYTFRIGMYGAAYLIGAYTALTNKDESDYKAAVLAANPFDRNVDGAAQGSLRQVEQMPPYLISQTRKATATTCPMKHTPSAPDFTSRATPSSSPWQAAATRLYISSRATKVSILRVSMVTCLHIRV